MTEPGVVPPTERGFYYFDGMAVARLEPTPAIEHGSITSSLNPTGNRGIHGIAGCNAVADEAARAAFEATCDASDRTRVVEQTGGASPGLYWYNGSGFVRLDPAGAQAQITNLEAAQFRGFDRRERYGRDGFPLAAGNVTPTTGTIPGPAAGYVRFLTALFVTADSATAAMVSVQLKPTDQFLTRPTSLIDTLGGTPYQQPIAMAAGESFLLTNTGSGSARVFYSYVDKPATNLTVVRVTANDNLTPVTVVPAATAGSMNRLVAVNAQIAGPNSTCGPKLCALASNDDTISNAINWYLGANRAGRSGALAALAVTGPQIGLEEITDAALAAAPRLPVSAPGPAARGFNIFACYETLPLPP